MLAGFDENADGDLADANDTKLVDEDFASGTASFTYCNAGNLVQDEKFTYTYDAWNRLVKVTARADSDVTIQTASYDGRGRRLKKTVTNTGQHDGTVVFYYDGWKLIETRDGSGNLYQQFIHGTQYIDELVMMRVKDKGDLYVHQDANWNVIALTDLGGNVVERYTYTPYGQMTVQQVTSYGDRDGDGVVDSTDKGTPGTTCTGTVTGSCRIVDLDFDGDYDATDATLFDDLDQGQARHPDRTTTAVDFPFGHQGLYYDAELESYQNRYRQYNPVTKKFMQKDPLALLRASFDPNLHHFDGMNLYAYVMANPLRSTDPNGTICTGWASTGTGGGGGWHATGGSPTTGGYLCSWRRCRTFTRTCYFGLFGWCKRVQHCHICCGAAVTVGCPGTPGGGGSIHDYCNSPACAPPPPTTPLPACTPGGAGGC